MASRFPAEHVVARVVIDVGAATREFTFQKPYGVKITRSYGAADAADGTDKVTPTVTVGGTTIKTCTVINTTDTIIEDVGCDTGQSDFIPAGVPFKVVMTFGGTATNVKGIVFELFGVPKA